MRIADMLTGSQRQPPPASASRLRRRQQMGRTENGGQIGADSYVI